MPEIPVRTGAGLKVLAVFQCMFGALGLFSPLFVYVSARAEGKVSVALNEAMWTGGAAILYGLTTFAAFALGGAALAAGLGIFLGKRWARRIGLAHGAGSLAIVVVGQIAAIFFVYPVLVPFLSSRDPMEIGGAVGGLVGGIAGAVVQALLPLVELVVLTRKSVVEAYASGPS